MDYRVFIWLIKHVLPNLAELVAGVGTFLLSKLIFTFALKKVWLFEHGLSNMKILPPDNATILFNSVSTYFGGIILLNGALLSAVASVFGLLIINFVANQSALNLYEHKKFVEFLQGLAIGAGCVSTSFAVLALLGVYHVSDVSIVPQMFIGLSIGIESGICEEIFFRGFILRIIEPWLGSLMALIISSIIFGVVHLNNLGASFKGPLPITLHGGVLMGSAYLVTRRLWLPIGIHIAWNTFTSAIFGADVSGIGSGRGLFKSTLTGNCWLSGGAMGVEGSIVTVLIVNIVGVILFWMAQIRNLDQPGVRMMNREQFEFLISGEYKIDKFFFSIKDGCQVGQLKAHVGRDPTGESDVTKVTLDFILFVYQSIRFSSLLHLTSL